MSVELSFAPNAEAGVKERSEGEHVREIDGQKGRLAPWRSRLPESGGTGRETVVGGDAPRSLRFFCAPARGPPAAQQELSVVSGTLPELQGAGQSGHRARAVEEAPRQVPSAQEVE